MMGSLKKTPFGKILGALQGQKAVARSATSQPEVHCIVYLKLQGRRVLRMMFNFL